LGLPCDVAHHLGQRFLSIRMLAANAWKWSSDLKWTYESRVDGDPSSGGIAERVPSGEMECLFQWKRVRRWQLTCRVPTMR
jgi:hypothetical protein